MTQRRRIGLAPLLAIVALLVAAVGWGGDYQSCLRNSYTRKTLTVLLRANAAAALARTRIDTPQNRRLDQAVHDRDQVALARLRPLDCLSVLPPTR